MAQLSAEELDAIYNKPRLVNYSKNLYKFTCGDVLSSEDSPLECPTHHTPRAFIKRDDYNIGFVSMHHQGSFGIKNDRTQEYGVALHRCERDEYNFISKIERTPLTEIVAIDQEDEDLEGVGGLAYSSQWKKIIPEVEWEHFKQLIVLQSYNERMALFIVDTL